MEWDAIFSTLLSISYPFKLSRKELLKDEQGKDKIVIYIEVDPTYRPPGYSHYHDRYTRRWRHLSIMQCMCEVECDVIIYRNPATGESKTLDIPWARPQSGFTLLFEQAVLAMLGCTNCISQTAAIFGLYPQRVRSIYEHYTQQSFDKFQCSTPVELGIDETSRRKGHDYITVFVDMEKGKIVDIEEGKDAQCIEKFVGKQSCPQRIQQVSMDMSPAFIKGVDEYLPQAQKTFDKFHVYRLVYRHIDQLKANCKQDLAEKLQWLSDKFELLYQQKDARQASAFLAYWIDALQEILGPNTLSKSLKKHFDGIINYFHSNLTNGILEGINSKIQTLKRIARGYKYTHTFKRMIFFAFGLLDLKPSKIT